MDVFGASGHAIFINGVQGAGKSTVAEEIGRRSSTFHVVSGDELIRQFAVGMREPEPRHIFARVLDAIEDRLASNNVVLDAALPESYVREARGRFTDLAMFVILRVVETDRARRERSRQHRPLGHEFRPEWHAIVGPDELYDLVLDSSTLDVPESASRILSRAQEIWSDITL